MTILDLVFTAYNIVGTGFSIAGAIDPAIKKYYKTTTEELFKKSFVKVVKQYASDFADQTDPKTVEVDSNLLDKVITSLKDDDIVQLTQLKQSEKIAKITTLFQNCIIVPNHQLPNMDFERRIRPIIERVIIDFYSQLPFNQGAFNRIVLEYIQNNIKNQDEAHTMLSGLSSTIDYVRNEVTQRLSEDIRAIKDDTEKIKDENKEIKQKTQATFDLVGRERMHLQSVLDVAVDFLFTLWEKSIPFRQKEFLTLGLLTGLTYGRDAHTVLNRLEYLIQNKHRLFLPAENSILRQIRNFQQIYPLEDNFMFLAENDIRLKGTRVGIETILYEYIYNSKMPVVIADYYYTPTLEQVYATILYYLQNQEKVGTYLENYLEYCRKAREEYEKNPPPGAIRLRELIAERKANSDTSYTQNSKKQSNQHNTISIQK